MKKDDDNHDNCALCLPEEFKVEVDMYFLRMVKNHYDSLNRIKPNYYTTKFHGEQIEKMINKALKNQVKS